MRADASGAEAPSTPTPKGWRIPAWKGTRAPRPGWPRARTKTSANCICEPHVVALDALSRRRLVFIDSIESVAPKGIVRAVHGSCGIFLVVSTLSSTCGGTGGM